MMDETRRIEHELIDLSHEWMRAWIRKDEVTLNRVLADDFLITSARSTGELATKSDYLQNALHGWTATTFVYERLQVRLYGEMTIVHAFARQTVTVEDKVILPRICGRRKASNKLFPKESRDHAKSAKVLYGRV